MSKKCYRFFGGVLKAQENWLNKMSSKGYRLVRTTKLMYEFEECKPGEYQYKVEFIGNKSQKSANEYVMFLEDCCYNVFYKNINLDYSVGKVTYRPWAEKGGRVATNSTTYNKELLIIEKVNDGKAFDLYTTYEDKKEYYIGCMKPWIFTLIFLIVLYIATREMFLLVFAGISCIGIFRFLFELLKLMKKGDIKEW